MMNRANAGHIQMLPVISSTAYDTAWVAMLPHPERPHQPYYPGALSWIALNQLPDGSWGSTLKYEHDRIICTLAALIPLVKFGRRGSDQAQVRRGERYLWQHAHLLQYEKSELVGYELLIPTLMQMALDTGVEVPPHLDVYTEERIHKLAQIPSEMIYSPYITTAHSLEFLGSDVDASRLHEVQSENGSIGNSPAATAFMLLHCENPHARAYLEQCMSKSGDGGVPVLEPFENFEALWVAYNLFLGGTPASALLAPEYRPVLQTALATGGVRLSPSFPVPDADNTAVALLLLHEAGEEVDPSVLQHFELDELFMTYPFERGPSTSANIHVLAALSRFPSYMGRDRAIRKILNFLADSRHKGGYWFDKWHISPYYATSHAIVAMSELPAEYRASAAPLIDEAINWIIHTQHENGSWGYWGVPTTEETAYAVLALRYAEGSVRGTEGALHSGISYLQAFRMAPRPALWIGKCLYYPTNVVDSAIQALSR